MNIRNLLAGAIALFSLSAFADITISNLKVEPVSPWGKCHVTFNLNEEMEDDDWLLLQINGTSYSRVFPKGEVAGTTSCKVVWDFRADGFSVDPASFSIEATMNPQYLVVDLSSGASSSKYPVTCLVEPPSGGFNVDAYKTSKLVMRRIEPGTYKMGGSVSTTISKTFYVGLFEVTQRQWSLVMGADPCSSTSYGKGNTYPVHYVSYDAIRGSSNGAKWPSSSAVNSSSFLGKLRARTGIDFDLPTEAQWEYACRAGTTTTYYWGDSINGNYAWHTGNSSSKTHPVGGRTANAWGLYDMSGNVWEWCLDWYGSLTGGSDPKGAASGSRRVGRGGSWNSNASNYTSSYRGGGSPSYSSNNYGFRLASHPGL